MNTRFKTTALITSVLAAGTVGVLLDRATMPTEVSTAIAPQRSMALMDAPCPQTSVARAIVAKPAKLKVAKTRGGPRLEITPTLARASRSARGMLPAYYARESIAGISLLPGRMAIVQDKPNPYCDPPACSNQNLLGLTCSLLRNGKVLIIMPCYDELGKIDDTCEHEMKKDLGQ